MFYVSSADWCGSSTRCNLAATAGAIGCLLYNVGPITGLVFSILFSSRQSNHSGASNIPSGSISLKNGLSIIATVAANSSAIYTFTDLFEPTPVVSKPND